MRLPNLLVLDEPLQGVDYTGEAELYELIAAIVARRGCGVLMVSHDLHVVMAATDRVVCLNHHVCCTGAPEEIVGHDEFRRLFGPRAAAGAAVYKPRPRSRARPRRRSRGQGGIGERRTVLDDFFVRALLAAIGNGVRRGAGRVHPAVAPDGLLRRHHGALGPPRGRVGGGDRNRPRIGGVRHRARGRAPPRRPRAHRPGRERHPSRDPLPLDPRARNGRSSRCRATAIVTI